MALPATKRRKLRHGEHEFSSDISADGGSSDDGLGAEKGDGLVQREPTGKISRHSNGQEAAQKKMQRKQEPKLHAGMYTTGEHKSNMFKLQVDELLQQTKLSYGRKEAPAENAMRTLKHIIEHLPSREAMSVCNVSSVAGPFADMRRYPTQKHCSGPRGS
jgi:U3 small nucleolar RNA-associated protein 22